MPTGIVRRFWPELLSKIALFPFSPLFFGHRGLSIDGSMPAIERTRLGMMLQCKGLMEIVAAGILLKAGLVTQTSFAILVTRREEGGGAVVSTALTVPIFRAVSAAASRRPGIVPATAPDR